MLMIGRGASARVLGATAYEWAYGSLANPARFVVSPVERPRFLRIASGNEHPVLGFGRRQL
jgi:hypothetical protein